jgi:GNAT superfamily N-acetyltransferase
MSTAIAIASLPSVGYERWLPLATQYKAFYETVLAEEQYRHAWARINTGAVSGWGAMQGDRLVGIAHALLHGSTWADRVCYLQDLYVIPDARGLGIARTLIESVARYASDAGCARYYWLTQHHNATARALYDKLAAHHWFIRYDYPL